MRLAVFQPIQSLAGQRPHRQIGIKLLEPDQRRRQQFRNRCERRDDKLSLDLVALPPDPADKLSELIVGCLSDLQKVQTRIRSRIPPRMPLEELYAQRTFKRVYVSDDRGMVDTKRLSRARYRPDLRHAERSLYFIPSDCRHG